MSDTGVTVKIGPNGRIVLPAEIRRKMGVGPGDSVVLEYRKNGTLQIVSRREAVRQAQALVRKFVGKDRRLSQELSDERRKEAARD
jgi:AbrB family looped-hinge helix DNA binding protein